MTLWSLSYPTPAMTPDAFHKPASPFPRRSSHWLLCVSLLFHILILLLIARPFKNPPQKIIHKPKVIKATLVYPKFTAPLPSPEPQPEIKAEEKVVPAAEEKSPLTIDKPVPLPPVVKTVPPVEEKTVNVPPKSAVIIDNQGPSAQEQVQQQLKGFNRQAIADVAAEEAARYRRQLNSPSLLDKPATSQLSEDEKFRKARQVRANCSNIASQGVAILSMIGGGDIKCTNQPDIDAFIQDRLNKK
jgi:outer membrane biosynthesis protein TonB